MISAVDVLTGRYYDSVRLMQVTRDVAAVGGVDAAMVAMATDLNVRLLADAGFDIAQIGDVHADDLMIAIRGVDEAAMTAARAAVEIGLASRRPAEYESVFSAPPAHTVGSAAQTAGANLALISVPGTHAFVEAMDALDHGLHVMIFSDNVPIEHELHLKQTGQSRGLLVMGPDCGTAIVGGVGLGFANAVDPGPVAISGASGTGIQQLCCLLDAWGVGVRHALGTGSRDLSAAVGGSSTLQAIAALDADPAVELIIVVSKPPDPSVAVRVEQAVEACRKPVEIALLGEPCVTLEGAARRAVAALGKPADDLPRWVLDQTPDSPGGVLRGFFSGGTLRDEARVIAADLVGDVSIDPAAEGHRLVDYGGEQFTRGRAHPMIDPSIRLQALADAASDPATGVMLLDAVLGYGAHPDPGAEVAPLIELAAGRGIPVVVSLCGARRDPQGRDRQATALRDAGAEVYLSNAAAAHRAASLLPEPSP